MNNGRINDVISINKAEIEEMFHSFDASIHVLDFNRMQEGMSNTGYLIRTESQQFLLKLYSKSSDRMEVSMYRYLKDKVSVPELYWYDYSKRDIPFAYTITEFVEGETLTKYIRTRKQYPLKLISDAGRVCGQIHLKRFSYDAMLDDRLVMTDRIPVTREKIMNSLEGRPATHLQKETVQKLKEYLRKYPEYFDQIEEESVLCHGDFNYGNLLIGKNKMYCIDFEFTFSGSRYHDIGHFFRRKDSDIQNLIDAERYLAFAQGYQEASGIKLPKEWLKLAQLCDISAMLGLLNYEQVPVEWITDIERDILIAVMECD